MMSQRKIETVLGAVLFGISTMLIARSPPRFAEWPSSLGTLLSDLVLLAFPVIGVMAGAEFLRKDNAGWAGILFHLVIFYTAIGYSIMAAVDITTAAQLGGPAISGILDAGLAGLGWFALLLYYD
ncbi:MAG: hypothetical protein JW839_06170 [Candidatus Lokiarchaeota archaeon]|nr:hypothetical protein [Candidatus Lokiarchaeota archaeon]